MLSLGTPVRSGHGPAALAAGLVWAGVIASLTLWWLHLPKEPAPAATVVGMSRLAEADKKPGAVERALGHTAPTLPAPDLQKRFALIGVIASARGQGSALIAVDGQPARTYLVGQELESGWKVKEVAAQRVVLQLRDSTIKITLPELKQSGWPHTTSGK